MTVEVTLAALAGEYMESAVVQAWAVKEGQAVAAGDPLVVVETAKASVEIPAPASGVVERILVPAGREVPLGTVLARIAAGDDRPAAGVEGAPASVAAPREAATAPPGPADARAGPAFVRATPLARAVARELGVSLASVAAGTGHAVVSEADVRRAAAGLEAPDAPARSRVAALAGYRRAAAEHVAQALGVPQFSLTMTCDAGRLEEIRAARKQARGAAAAAVPSVTDFVVKAVAGALRQWPRLNARWDAGRVLLLDDVNVGVAMATDHGLVVPVVRAADRRTLRDLSAELGRLRGLAEALRLAPEDLRGGTFTVSNLGMFGVDRFTALVNPPQAAILAVGAVRTRVVWEGGRARPGRCAELTLTSDHRVVDGADAARFLAAVTASLEDPDALAP